MGCKSSRKDSVSASRAIPPRSSLKVSTIRQWCTSVAAILGSDCADTVIERIQRASFDAKATPVRQTEEADSGPRSHLIYLFFIFYQRSHVLERIDRKSVV